MGAKRREGETFLRFQFGRRRIFSEEVDNYTTEVGKVREKAQNKRNMAKFVKGEMPPIGKQINEDVAREYQRRSAQSRLAKKHGKELVRALLEMKETDPEMIKAMEALGFSPKGLTNEIVMHARQIEKAKRKADTKAYTAVQKAAGYEETTINENADPRIMEMSKETIAALSKWSGKE